MSTFKRGLAPLEGMTEPELGTNHNDRFNELHEFAVRAFTWKTKPEDLAMLDTIEHVVDEFMDEYVRPAEVIIAQFNTDKSMGVDEQDRLFLNLQSAVTAIEEEVTRRYLKAQYAWYMLDDKYWVAWRKPSNGTQKDLEAVAKLETKEDRQFYFVQYAAWRMINDKVQSLKATQRYIQNQLYRRS
jgi:hypothetical protein